jgi:hypothetical protein
MRQMGPRYRPYSDHTVLLVGEYNGQGATCEQFVKTMATAAIRVMFEGVYWHREPATALRYKRYQIDENV